MRFQLKKYRDNFDYGLFGRPITDILNDGFFNSFDSNITETGTGYRMEIAVPGMSQKDLTIQVEGDTMTITGKAERRQTYQGSSMTTEFNSQQFSRSFTLPPNADVNAIKSKCRNGLLSIEIPKLKHFSGHRHIMIEDAEFEELADSSVPKAKGWLSRTRTWLKNKLMNWMLD